MEHHNHKNEHRNFHSLKLAKKQQLTKNTFALEFDIPTSLQHKFLFKAGQYITVQINSNDQQIERDYSITNAPYENRFAIAIKINSENSAANLLYQQSTVGDTIQVSEPSGRFTLESKPNEFRTILGFASGIGITPILSHFKNILHTEPRTRLYLFYGNKTVESTVFYQELLDLQKQYFNRLEVHFFYTEENVNHLYKGRIDEKKVELIINQILSLDETDEESTIWDSVDEVLICGKGEMIKSVANACYQHGIRKKNIHFELFETYHDDIYPVEIEIPIIKEIQVQFKYQGEVHKTVLNDNREKLLQSLLLQKFSVPFSCKSGICGTCICKLKKGEVELLENEYLTEIEEKEGKILACMAFPQSQHIELDFDIN